jgi:hypothetical protein
MKILADVSQYFDIRAADRADKQNVPRRKQPIRPVFGLTEMDTDTVMNVMFEAFGLAEYGQCWTFEMASRPVPFVSTDERPLKVLRLFERYIEPLMAVLIREVVPHHQTFNKVSRLGWPVHRNPRDEDGRLIKMEVFTPLITKALAGDWAEYEQSYFTINVRSQVEDPTKVREMQFINDDGVITTREVDRRQLQEWIQVLGRDAIPPRTRAVFCPPILNLGMQLWDTMLHRAIMKHPLCEANIYSHAKITNPEDYQSFDCKHYERDLGMCVLRYADYVGGLYSEWMKLFLRIPYLVPSDSWRKVFLVTPRYGDGVYPQFASGICCVSTLGKLANMCVQLGYFEDVIGLRGETAIHAMLAGEYNGLRRWMFGDDNRVRGEASARRDYIEYLGAHFHIEIDDTPRFLGSVLDTEVHEFRLPAETYLLKWALPERDSETKTYPALGYKLRRETFSEYGQPQISRDIIPMEDRLIAEHGFPWSDVMVAAHREEMNARQQGVTLNPLQVLDKEYLMTDEEKAKSGDVWGFTPAQTNDYLKQLIGKSTLKSALNIS